MTICVQDRKHGFSGSVNLRNRPLKFLITIILDMTGCRHVQNVLWQKCWKIRNCMEVIENILRCVKKQKSQNQQMSYFSPYFNFSCPYLKIDLCD